MNRGSTGVRSGIALRLGLAAGLGLLPLVLAACGSGGTAASTAGTTTTAAPAEKAVTIRVNSVVTTQKQYDVPPRGTSAGDRIVFTDTLVNVAPQFGKAAKARVGTDRWTMTFTSAHSARVAGEAVLPDGKIRFAGPLTPGATNGLTIPVVGGTGRYAQASGVLVVGSGTSSSLNVYRLVIGTIPGPAA
jgi:hypothetical protein